MSAYIVTWRMVEIKGRIIFSIRWEIVSWPTPFDAILPIADAVLREQEAGGFLQLRQGSVM